jgi:hypothetical protein
VNIKLPNRGEGNTDVLTMKESPKSSSEFVALILGVDNATRYSDYGTLNALHLK